jgi:hypothetical protein
MYLEGDNPLHFSNQLFYFCCHVLEKGVKKKEKEKKLPDE